MHAIFADVENADELDLWSGRWAVRAATGSTTSTGDTGTPWTSPGRTSLPPAQRRLGAFSDVTSPMGADGRGRGAPTPLWFDAADDGDGDVDLRVWNDPGRRPCCERHGTRRPLAAGQADRAYEQPRRNRSPRTPSCRPARAAPAGRAETARTRRVSSPCTSGGAGPARRPDGPVAQRPSQDFLAGQLRRADRDAGTRAASAHGRALRRRRRPASRSPGVVRGPTSASAPDSRPACPRRLHRGRRRSAAGSRRCARRRRAW